MYISIEIWADMYIYIVIWACNSGFYAEDEKPQGFPTTNPPGLYNTLQLASPPSPQFWVTNGYNPREENLVCNETLPFIISPPVPLG